MGDHTQLEYSKQSALLVVIKIGRTNFFPAHSISAVTLLKFEYDAPFWISEFNGWCWAEIVDKDFLPALFEQGD